MAPTTPFSTRPDGLAGRLRLNRVPPFAALLAAACAVPVTLASPSLAVLLAVAAAIGCAVAVVVRSPPVSLAVLLLVVVLVEDDAAGGTWPSLPQLYAPLPAVPIVRVTDVLVGLVVVAAIASARRSTRQRPPGALIASTMLLAAAVAIGTVNGLSDPGAELGVIVAAARPFVYLAVIPWLVLALDGVRRWERTLLLGLAALVIVKAAVGSLFVLGELAPVAGRLTVSYYAAVTNWLCVLYLAVVASAAAMRVRLPWFVLAGTPLVVLSLVLSYRRSFWLALVFALAVVALARVARRQSARPRAAVTVGAVAATVAAAGLMFSGALPADLSQPVRERLESFSTSGREANRFDSYRVGEQRNIVAALRSSPVLGLGLGVPWPVTEPLSLRFDNDRLYSHVVLTNWWLKFGFIGPLAYLFVLGVALRAAMRRAVRSGSGAVAALAIGAAAAVVGLAVAETTASFTGVDSRLTIALAVLLGLVLREPGRDTAAPAARPRAGS